LYPEILCAVFVDTFSSGLLTIVRRKIKAQVTKIAVFSSRGPVKWKGKNGIEQILEKPDIVARGEDVRFSDMNEFRDVGGTSISAPIVAGAVALLKQKYPELNADQIKNILKKTAVDLHEPKNSQGAGRINILDAINYKPLSKIENNDSVTINGYLIVKIQRDEMGEWIDKRELFNQWIDIPGFGLVKLDTGKDNLGNTVLTGFNNLYFQIYEKGNYRIYVSFTIQGYKKEAFWDFKVSETDKK